MSAPVRLVRDGHPTFLKWHRARRTKSDPVFTGRRILEGMAEGASVEVDLVIHADKGMAVLHNLEISKETTGSGMVDTRTAAELRALHLRDNAGAPIPDKVMLLEDLAQLLAQGDVHPDALLQLDYKQDATVLDAVTVANFAAAIGPVAPNMILSSGDAASVALLTDATPGLKIGYDPCHDGALERLAETRDYQGFVADAVAASPKAEMIYLEYRLALAAADHGFDIVAAFHAENRRIDAYTIKLADVAGLATIERLLALKVDQITTDDPEGVFAALG
jgi:glycerophosphoryl diester phosphodiesterase